MPLGRRKRDIKPPKEGQVPATPSPKSDNSSAISTLTEDLQKPSRGARIWNSVTSFLEVGSASGRSTRAPTPTPSPGPANFTQNDTTSSMHTASASPGTGAQGNGTIITAPIQGPLKLGELLQQEASDLWTKAYNELSVEYQQDLKRVGNTDSDKPEKLETLKQLLEHAMEAKKENIANQWKLKWGGKEINVREKMERLVGWITKFKEVVDIAVQYDPVHAALPWAGIRFILIACPHLWLYFSCQFICLLSLINH